MPQGPHLVDDMQASAPPVELALSRAGVTGVQKAIRIRRGDAETVMAADIECTVDLARGQKGVHMSRFPEVFDEAIGDAVLGEARIIEEIAEVIARHIVERQNAHRAEVRITARWPMRRVTPVTHLPTQEMVSLIGIAAATAGTSKRVVGVEATGINACPCAQGLVAGRAAERLTEAGFEADAIEQILQLVPIATHNQRGRGTLLVGTTSEIDAESLVDLVERSMSAPVFELLKRPDELFVVEHAHLQPRFVEDSVRVALKNLLDDVPGLANEDFVLSRQVNLETIHAHDVLAERWGTVGELRREMHGVDTARQTTLADWLTT
jgi:GTP cyclohydrolase I/GTP cyclohydrolase-4